MSRGYYNPGAPFLYTGGEPGSGMDCLQLRQSAGPFHYLINEQAKSLVALQELQNEVGALLDFRDLVIETFPNLRTKMANSTPTTMTSHASNIPIAVRREWEPGVRVRRKITHKDESRGKKSGEIGVQDSGFSTETSSKETHSASSSAPPPSTSAIPEPSETDDELWNLLDVIHRKGTRLKDELEALHDSLRTGKENSSQHSDDDFQRVLLHASVDDVRHLRRERDLLLDRVAEMEAELLAGRVHTSRLQEDLENLICAKQDLEEQLKSVMTQSGEVNTRIHDLHTQFVTNKSTPSSPENVKSSSDKGFGGVNKQPTSQRSRRRLSHSVLDSVLGESIPRIKVPDSNKIGAILKERDPLVLQKHLLNSTVYNQVLQQQLDTATTLEHKLDKAREENEDLRFQLEDKNIELEGTRARVRMLEQLQRPATTSPDIIPNLESVTSESHDRSRVEITTASMKAMSPLPLNLQFDHSSSTESAHDQAESARKGDSGKKKPSKIPLVKSYAAPKPPGGKHSPAPSARSRSGDSPGRAHSAQSVRHKSDGNSLTGSKNSSLSKSRNVSLSNTKDSLTGKLRSAESLTKLRESSINNSLNSNRSTKRDLSLRRSSGPVRRSNSIRDTTDGKVDSSTTKGKSLSLWVPSSLNSDSIDNYPDSLDLNESVQPVTIETSSSYKYQTANNFLWNRPEDGSKEFYDSIDTNFASSLYQEHGEEMAECDSLEKQFSDTSDKDNKKKKF